MTAPAVLEEKSKLITVIVMISSIITNQESPEEDVLE
jgi:hypothetical protein